MLEFSGELNSNENASWLLENILSKAFHMRKVGFAASTPKLLPTRLHLLLMGSVCVCVTSFPESTPQLFSYVRKKPWGVETGNEAMCVYMQLIRTCLGIIGIVKGRHQYCARTEKG